MMHCNRRTRGLHAITASALVASLLATGAMAAPPNLQTIAVTPANKTLSTGQKQSFTATGTFSNGSTHVLGPAIRKITPGWVDTCALLASGGVECWGDNQYGQLGDGRTVDSLVARPVKWIATATEVAVGQGHACARLARGAVQCWGANDAGQLGNGTANPATTPVPVSGISTATALALGPAPAHSCALLTNGKTKCWGYNFHGELGNGTNAGSSIPVTVTGISTATQVTVGNSHGCALLVSGTVQCWGDNYHGQLGNGTNTPSNIPVTVSGIDSATAVAAGGFFTCALLADGTIKCWGHGGNAELGNGSSWPYADSLVPVSVVGISTAIAITAGGYHACALLADGSVQCWGYNNYGQLGNSALTASASNTPVSVGEINAPVRLAAGLFHTCALLSDGALRCWGLNDAGQLGNRQKTDYNANRRPVNVVGTPGVSWQSSDPSKATISGRGLATALAIGNTTITATSAALINDNVVLTVK